MTFKIKILPVLLIITASLLFSSCSEGTSDRISAAEIEAYENYVMSSYFMLRGDTSIDESRAAWDYTETVAFPTGSTPTTATSKNYPEKGQTTTVTISKVTGVDDVYKVVNVTTYPRRDAITSTTESYYVNDNTSGSDASPDGTYDATVDPICDVDGNSDSLERIEFKTLYDDGTERDETIVATKDSTGGPEGAVSYAGFNIDGPMVFPNSDDSSTLGGGTLSGDVWTPGANASAAWSSMVSYDQELTYEYRLWTYSEHIIGIRYYTEIGDERTSVTYERVIGTISVNEDYSDYSEWITRLFNRRNRTATGSADGTTYTETVIRTLIDGNKKKQVESSSQIYDEAGATVVTFEAYYEEDENGVVTNSGVPVAVY